jgi:hypothetical protein
VFLDRAAAEQKLAIMLTNGDDADEELDQPYIIEREIG